MRSATRIDLADHEIKQASSPDVLIFRPVYVIPADKKGLMKILKRPGRASEQQAHDFLLLCF
jgi:hypothetical protein